MTPAPHDAAEDLLTVEGLNVRFGPVHAVRGVGLRLAPGECLALVGESGSGKSTVARALLGLPGPGSRTTARTLRIDGRDATAFGARDWRTVRGRTVGLVSQDALVSLDPLRRIGREVAEPLRLHGTVRREEVAERVVELLRQVGIPDAEARAAQYPHELSGGLRQRALIASALAARPRLLIADEPTTALDVTVQAQVLELLDRAKADGMGLLFISHDLGVVARIADRTAVLQDGAVVESGATADVLRQPRHPLTRTLLEASAPAPPRRPDPARSTAPALTVTSVTKRYGSRTAVRDVSFTVAAGETVGLVGESGSGKSTVARIAMGLLVPDSGTVHLGPVASTGTPWSALPERRRRPLRHRIQLVQQDTYGTFDPRFTVARALAEALPGHADPRGRSLELLDSVGLSPEHLRRRPHELSGGQRQRVAIARALATGPTVLVCDEPVSALDASVQAKILTLLDGLRERLGLALLFISHDLSVIRRISDRVLVMKDAQLVEQGPARTVLEHPRHPYTKALLAAAPHLPAPAVRPSFTGRGAPSP